MNDTAGLTREQKRRLQAGDAAAFDDLYDRTAARVRGYLYRLSGSRSDAEDLTQETFLAAFAGRDAIGRLGSDSVLSWLLGIAYRRWRDGRRGQESRMVFTVLNEEIDSQPGLSGGDHAETVATSATLEAALARVSPAERDCLLLTAVEGLTYAEAARVLGEPAGTIKWRVHEATRALRRILSAAEERYDATSPTQSRKPERIADAAGGR